MKSKHKQSQNKNTLPPIKINHSYTLAANHSLPETVHVFDERSRNAIEAAWLSGRPLLIRGDPGTGKSQLARAAASALGWQFTSEVINAHTEIQDLWYRFDAVSRLGQAQILSAITSQASLKDTFEDNKLPDALNPEKFLSPGILWWSYDWDTARHYYANSHYQHFHPDSDGDPAQLPKGVVLLIDEIDKADADLPNSLLETLDTGRFRIPWINQTVGGQKDSAESIQPLVIITTNEDRQLPPAFLRRCLVLSLELPDEREALIAYLVRRGEQHFTTADNQPFFSKTVMQEVANELYKDRKQAQELGVTPPGQAEYLDILRILSQMTDDKDEQLAKLRQIKHFALRKYPSMNQHESIQEPIQEGASEETSSEGISSKKTSSEDRSSEDDT